MNKRDEGENHALVVHGQIVHVLAGIVPLLLHRPGNLGGEVVAAVLPLLPAGYVGFHTEDDRFDLFDCFIGRHRDQVNREDKVAGIFGDVGNQIVREEGSIGTQKQGASKLVAKFKVVAPERDTIRADQVSEVLGAVHITVIVIVKILLIAGTEKVMENPQPVIVHGGLDAGVEAGEGLLQICFGPAEILCAFLDALCRDRQGDKALLDKIVALRRPVDHDPVGFLPVVVEPVVLVRKEDSPFKLCGIEPVVDDGDLGGGVRGQGVQRPAIGFEDAFLCLLRGGNIVYVGQLPAPAVLSADLPNAVGVDAPDRDGVLHGARDFELDALTLVCGCEGFNQSHHAPFC